ncbi:ABC-type multidrug transport system permease subunit [Lederbergia wuyishanensis]|uniref:ABC-type multidrug transport system permease subunit n=1 Tax=Lederbergia wuyishanensis TaxID=1347903 RepID=A0ABU0D7E1_9BACI|nr:ABC-type multidrug transport system permease subunit [Lederbergia wuyishanensis]
MEISTAMLMATLFGIVGYFIGVFQNEQKKKQ